MTIKINGAGSFVVGQVYHLEIRKIVDIAFYRAIYFTVLCRCQINILGQKISRNHIVMIVILFEKRTTGFKVLADSISATCGGVTLPE
ncbi:hypothetical protein D3C71_1491710 [compost metagenome]